MFFPIATIDGQGLGNDAVLHNLGVVTGDQGMVFSATCLPLFLLLAIGAILTLVTIFLYKNRKLQMNLCNISLLFTVLWYVDYALMLFGIVKLPEVDGHMGLSFSACLPVVSIILLVMAKRGIDYDEKLVRAADRIR